MTGYITKGIGGFYYVKTSEGIVECKPRGIFRKQKITPVAGDVVTLETENGGAVIADIAPRRNIFVRPPMANLDVLFLVASTTQPTPSTLVLDKLSAIAVDKGVQPVIVCTKGDLAEAEFLRSAYEKSTLPFIRIDYATGEGLDDIKHWINGRLCAFCGNSGVGKSTLLNTLGCLDTPTSGEYLLDSVSVRTMSKPQRAILRNRKIGFVFQNYNLLPKTTAVENVELPLMYNSSVSATERRKRAIDALISVGLGDRLEHKSNQMSGGQMQRVAIARALVNNPAVILADEATGNLDTRTSFEILVLFQKLHAEGRTIIFVTHNPELAQYSSRNIRLRDGHVIEDTVNTHILSAAEALAALPKNDED